MKTWIVLLAGLSLSSAAWAAGHSVLYTVGNDSFEGYYISPAKNAPLVFLVHDWDGLTGYEIKRAEMLADLGYAVFCADLFGAGVRPTETAEKQRLTGELYADHEKMRSRLYGALDAAKAQGGHVDNAVAIGYCFGGGTVLELARSGADLKGFVTFHGTLKTPDDENYSKAKGQFLVFHGTADSYVTLDDFANLARELEKAGVKHEMTTYSGAPHAFTVFGADSYRKDADEESWRRFTQFLEEVLH